MSLPKLGKRRAAHDPRTLKLRSYLSLSRLPAAPDAFDYTEEVDREVGPDRWEYYGNDQIGNCVVCAAAHQITTWTSMVGTPVVPTTDQVVRDYSLMSGYDPRTGANDDGVVLLEAMRRWRAEGICGRKILAFTSIDPDDHDLIHTACWMFGGLMMGFAMPEAWQDHRRWGLDREEWLAPSRFHRFGPWSPNSWGGHCVLMAGADPSRFKIVTWDREIPCSWHAIDTYCDEIYAAVSVDWVNGQREAPNGFDLGRLLSDLQSIKR